jgi:hypothetical protein
LLSVWGVAPTIHNIAPRALCIRLAAWRQTAERVPSITGAVTSSPRRAGRQCMNHALGASAIKASSTWYGSNRERRSALSSPPIDTHTSV